MVNSKVHSVRFSLTQPEFSSSLPPSVVLTSLTCLSQGPSSSHRSFFPRLQQLSWSWGNKVGSGVSEGQQKFGSLCPQVEITAFAGLFLWTLVPGPLQDIGSWPLCGLLEREESQARRVRAHSTDPCSKDGGFKHTAHVCTCFCD
jgi:hypothetical protein